VSTGSGQAHCVPKAEIVAQGYDLSLSRYKEVIYEEAQHRPPLEILKDLAQIEREVHAGLAQLESMLR